MSSPQPSSAAPDDSASPPPYSPTALNGETRLKTEDGNETNASLLGSLVRSPSPAKRRASVMEQEHVETPQGKSNVLLGDRRGLSLQDLVKLMHTTVPKQGDEMEIDNHQQRGQSVDMLRTPPQDGPSDTEVPDVDEQIQIIYAACQRPLEEGVTMFIVNGTWFKAFLAQASDHEPSKDDPVYEGKLGPIDNANLVGSTRAVDNDNDAWITMKEGLTVGEDFEVVPEDAWNNLVQWYGQVPHSPLIRRNTVNTASVEMKNVITEFNPPIFTLYTLKQSNQPLSLDRFRQDALAVTPKRIIASKTDKYQHFLLTLKTTLGIPNTEKIRVWKLLVNSLPNGTKPIMDLSTFLDLEHGEQREVIDIKDTTAAVTAGKFNGSSFDLATAGLSADGLLVVEIEEEGEWPSDRVSRALRKNVGTSAPVSLTKGFPSASSSSTKLSTASGSTLIATNGTRPIATASSSTTRTVMTRSNGKTVGTCGLNNLGNTCYMNSALQCVRSVEELSKFFLIEEYKKELNPNNPLAHNGKVAITYAALLKNLFSPTCPSSFAPREFKNTIGRYAPSFSGFGQQDSQEFLAFLLDGLHEDLNRIQKKPYLEKPDSTDEMVGDNEAIAGLAKQCWDIYKARNDSAVADLFGGQYKSTLVCPECEKVSITFDPFMDLTLPLPLENLWVKTINFLPAKHSKSGFINSIIVHVELDKNSSIRSLKEFVANRMKVDAKNLVVSEVYRNKFYKHLEDLKSVGECIQTNDEIYIYEVESVPTNHPPPKGARRPATRSMLSVYHDYDEEPRVQFDSNATEQLLVPVFHRLQKETRARYASPDMFGVPFFIVLNKEEQKDYDTIVEKVIEKYQMFTTMNLYDLSRVQDSQQSEDISEIEIESTDDEPELKNGSLQIADEDKEGSEGFVDVSMKDATSLPSESDEAAADKHGSDGKTKTKRKRTTRRVLLSAWKEMFDMKILKNRQSDTIPTAWSGVDSNIPSMSSRIPARPVTPSAPRNSTAPSKGRTSIHRPSPPSSDVSDEDDVSEMFEDAESGEAHNSLDLMNDASDGDDEYTPPTTIGSKSRQLGRQNGIFSTVQTTRFYGKSSQPTKKPASEPVQDAGFLITLGEGIVCDWPEEAYGSVFCGRAEDDLRGMPLFEPKQVFQDAVLAQKRQLRESRRKQGIRIEDCLDEFSKEEILSEDDPWYCPRCKVHRRASKTFELWKCPDIIVMHLKRFSSSRNFRDKIDALIDFPIEGLDLTDRVGEKEEGRELIYDLFAVDNHYGGLGGGHYTAYAKNWEDKHWYSYDDSSARQVQPKQVVTAAAYLLFYRRRSSSPLGGSHFEKILNDAATEYSPNGSSSPSPSSSGSPQHSSSQSSGDGLRGASGGVLLPSKFMNSAGNRNASSSNLSTELLSSHVEDAESTFNSFGDDGSDSYGTTSIPISAPPYSHSILFGPPNETEYARHYSDGISSLGHRGIQEHEHMSFRFGKTVSALSSRDADVDEDYDEGFGDGEDGEVVELMPHRGNSPISFNNDMYDDRDLSDVDHFVNE